MKKMLTFLMAAAISMGVAVAQDSFLYDHYSQNFSTVAAGDWGTLNSTGVAAYTGGFYVNAANQNLEIRTGSPSVSKNTGRTLFKQVVTAPITSPDSIHFSFIWANGGTVSSTGSYLYFCDSNKKPIFGLGSDRSKNSAGATQWMPRLPLVYVNLGDSTKNFMIGSANAPQMATAWTYFKIDVTVKFNTKTYTIVAQPGTYTALGNPNFVASTAAAFVKTDAPFLDASANDFAILTHTIGSSGGTLSNTYTTQTLDDLFITQTKPFLGNANVNVNAVDTNGVVVKTRLQETPIGQKYTVGASDFDSFDAAGFYYNYNSAKTSSIFTTCDQTGGNINLVFNKSVSTVGPLVWAAKNDTANWNETEKNLVAGATPTAYQAGREVIFNGADTLQLVQIAKTVNLIDKDMTINKGRIIFNGAGNVKTTGNLNLNLSANDSIQILNTNSFAGKVNVKGGYLRLASGGFGTAKVSIQNSATIALPVTENRLLNEVDIANGSVLTVAATNANNQGIGGIVTGSGDLKIVAYGARNLFSPDLSAWTGTKITMVSQPGVTFNQLVQMYSTGTLNALSTHELVVDTLVQLNGTLTSASADTIKAIGALSGRGALGAMTNILNGKIGTHWIIGGLNQDSEFGGIIFDSQYKESGAQKVHLEKVGTATLTLSNLALTYSGNTNVKTGKLVLTGNLTSASDTVLVSEGAILQVIGKREIDALGAYVQTRGKILGDTKIAGTLESDGGTFSGNSLQLKGTSTLIAKVRNDSVAAVSFAVAQLEGGILNISPVNAYKIGDVFRVFPKELTESTVFVTGGFGTILNAEKWDTSTLYTDGLVKALADGSSAIKEHKSEVKAYFTNGTLVVSGLQSEDTYTVVNTSGALVNANEKLQSGIYFVVVKTANGTFTRKAANFQVK